ncbi:MAG: 3'-5' exonuclease, partial [Microthrixaceae bacterium]
ANLLATVSNDTWFGASTQLALTTTFRCPQTICDVASQFVSSNPAQFQKPMRSAHSEPGAPVRVVLDDDPRSAVGAQLGRISALVDAGGRTATVNVLGRYGFLRDTLTRPPANLDVTFRTVHASKGLEADYIVIVGLAAGTYGFPSRIADDPVLDLALPAPESFPHAEERRLFYVALTRARVEVTVIAPSARMSPFVTEIINLPSVITENAAGNTAATVRRCPACGTGTLTERTGRWGPFLGCTNFPGCTHTEGH